MEFVWKPRARYTLVGEALRSVIPAPVLCSVGCGGPACKYEDPLRWGDDQQAIKGLYSAWVTDSLLAMARPSTETIEKYSIIDQFKSCGVKTVINLQRPGEHASCGNPLEPESGFSYRPETFMENDIYFYNFGWDDYGVASLWTILDMMKVMAFAMEEGKMAVHCHAGLGRTGVLLACFLVYATRMSADQSITYVRAKRPNSIQTRRQLQCVRDFSAFLVPLRSVFSGGTSGISVFSGGTSGIPGGPPVSLSQYLTRQGHMLHGYERRRLRHLPKIVQLVCGLLLDIADNRQVIEEDVLEVPDGAGADVDVEASLRHFHRGFGTDRGRPRLPGHARHANEPPIFYHRKSLSYSDSDLRRLGSELNLLSGPLTSSVSQGDVPGACVCGGSSSSPRRVSPARSVASYGSSGSLWEQKSGPADSPLLRRLRQRAVRRSVSVGDPRKSPSRGNFFTRWRAEMRAGGVADDDGGRSRDRGKEEEEEEKSEVPFITIQTELSLEARRGLVAQALAVDLQRDGEAEHKHRVCVWQAELNQQGAWERLCGERDPFVLAGLMWAWLEQLREPVISAAAVQGLVQHSAGKQTAVQGLVQHSAGLQTSTLQTTGPQTSGPQTSGPQTGPQTALHTLDQGARQSLLCILDCMAHILVIPEKLESAFLERTIKAFTQLEKWSEEGREVYVALTTVLRPVLRDMRRTAVEEDQTTGVPSIIYPASPPT